MSSAKTINIEVGYEDDETITFVGINKGNIPLVRKALAYLYKQEQEEKQKARELASTCRNCQFSKQRNRYDHTLCCSKRIVNKYYKKVVRSTETCELFERKEENK